MSEKLPCGQELGDCSASIPSACEGCGNLLRDTIAALEDLHACDDPDCPDCLRVLPRLRAEHAKIKVSAVCDSCGDPLNVDGDRSYHICAVCAESGCFPGTTRKPSPLIGVDAPGEDDIKIMPPGLVTETADAVVAGRKRVYARMRDDDLRYPDWEARATYAMLLETRHIIREAIETALRSRLVKPAQVAPSDLLADLALARQEVSSLRASVEEWQDRYNALAEERAKQAIPACTRPEDTECHAHAGTACMNGIQCPAPDATALREALERIDLICQPGNDASDIEWWVVVEGPCKGATKIGHGSIIMRAFADWKRARDEALLRSEPRKDGPFTGDPETCECDYHRARRSEPRGDEPQ